MLVVGFIIRPSKTDKSWKDETASSGCKNTCLRYVGALVLDERNGFKSIECMHYPPSRYKPKSDSMGNCCRYVLLYVNTLDHLILTTPRS